MRHTIFLTPADRAAIDNEVCELLPHAPLWLAVDEHDHPLGFMLMEESHVDGLFVDPPQHGKGIGRALIDHALRQLSVITADVNEQNSQAIGFYQRMGFQCIGRSQTDDRRAYPLIHLRKCLGADQE